MSENSHNFFSNSLKFFKRLSSSIIPSVTVNGKVLYFFSNSLELSKGFIMYVIPSVMQSLSIILSNIVFNILKNKNKKIETKLK